MNLYPDQIETLDRVRLAMRQHKNVLLQAPCGFGKTVVGAHMAKAATERGHSVVWINHRDVLLDQTARTFGEAGLFYSFIAAGRRHNPYAPIQIASIATLQRRLDAIPAPTLCLIDEAHHLGALGWSAVYAAWPQARVVGFTATPWRLDGEGLGKFFSHMVEAPSVRWLIEHKRLSEYVAYTPAGPDLGAVHVRAGDFVTEELEEILDRGALIGDLVRHYQRHAASKRALYFGVSVRHSQHIAATFQASGIPALHLDGDSTSEERVEAAKRFAARDLLVLTNCGLFGEGFDIAALTGQRATIECVGMARPTQSLSLYVQMVMRALRAKPERAVILDHAGNIHRHGFPDDDRHWSLADRERKKKSEAEKDIAVKTCPACFAAHRAHLRTCPYCGHVYQVIGRQAELLDGQLHEANPAEIRKLRKMEEWRAKTPDDLVRIGRERGYRHPEAWAAHMWMAREQREQQRAEERNVQLNLWRSAAYWNARSE